LVRIYEYDIGRIIGIIDKKFVKLVNCKDLLIIKKIKIDEKEFEPEKNT
jgi:hypothetical protein